MGPYPSELNRYIFRLIKGKYPEHINKTKIAREPVWSALVFLT